MKKKYLMKVPVREVRGRPGVEVLWHLRWRRHGAELGFSIVDEIGEGKDDLDAEMGEGFCRESRPARVVGRVGGSWIGQAEMETSKSWCVNVKQRSSSCP
jgi:hypothetical protein